MEETINKQRNELFLVVGLVTLYVIRQLIGQVERFEDLYTEAVAGQGGVTNRIIQQLGAYDHTLNNNIPLIGGALLVLLAWFVFHRQAFPRLQHHPNDQQGWLLMGLAGGLLLAATLLYHYLKLQVNERYNGLGDMVGLRVYSLFRKRTVLADAVGFGIILGVYEVAYQYHRSFARQPRPPGDFSFQLIGYLVVLGSVTAIVLGFIFTGQFFETLWGGALRDTLLLLGLGLQIILFQQVTYATLLRQSSPSSGSQSTTAPLANHIGLLLLVIFSANTLLWGAATNFVFRPRGTILPLSGVVLVGTVVIAYLRQVLNREKTVLQTQVSAGEAELAGLRAQINPHFLFNALNSLYATALKEKSEQTADGIQKLGDMMRFMLHENHHDRIPLDKEIEYLRNYITLQRMRIDDTGDIVIRVNIQEPDRPVSLAPMLLIPFVENAFKHGISLRQPSWINVTLTTDATQLYFRVHNSRHEKRPNDPEADHTGVGLPNVRKRLELIYPNRHQLVIQQSEQDYFVALTLTLAATLVGGSATAPPPIDVPRAV